MTEVITRLDGCREERLDERGIDERVAPRTTVVPGTDEIGAGFIPAALRIFSLDFLIISK